MTSLDIGIPAGSNSELYVNHLIYSIEKYTSDLVKRRYIIGVNSQNVDCVYIENIFKNLKIEKYKIVKNIQRKKGISDGHGKCLDSILEEMTATYGVFLDSDVYMLSKDWDQLLIKEINDKNIIVGSEYHPSDGKIVNFPNVITCLFDVKKFKDMKISFVPKMTIITANKKDSYYYGVTEGDKVFLDTGCHIAKDIKSAGYTGTTLKIVSPRYSDTIADMKFMKENMRGEEYQLKGIPISTHIGRSSSRMFNHDPHVSAWKKRIKEWSHGKV
jgi:hypothetical protein